ncbi:hypothetical protein [Ectopseudomonas oleovorans]|uniref:hypothetical protein n=1 Tax=Ectopseudomonas oleovorans TaxID=301 RepID=UPI003F1B89AE
MQPLALNHEHKPCGCPACGERKALNAEQQAREELDELVADELGDWVPVIASDPVGFRSEGRRPSMTSRLSLAGLLNEMDDSTLIGRAWPVHVQAPAPAGDVSDTP